MDRLHKYSMWSLMNALWKHDLQRYCRQCTWQARALCMFCISRPVASRHLSVAATSPGHYKPHSEQQISSQANVMSLSSKSVCRRESNKTASPKSYHSSQHLQAGHNKWSKIKRKKAIADMDRSRYTQRYVRKIISAIRIGGSSCADKNLQLASVIEQAKAVGVPKANVESAIQRASSKMSSSSSEAVMFDARGPSGYLLLIEAMTDNIKRTRPQIKVLLEKNGGTLAETGSSLFNFEHKAIIHIPCLSVTSDPLELAIEVGAEDVLKEESKSSPFSDDESPTVARNTTVMDKTSLTEQEQSAASLYQFKCAPDNVRQVLSSLRERGLEPSATSFEYLPKSFIYLHSEAYNRASKLVSLLCEHEDVLEVTDNFLPMEEQT